MTTPRLSTGQPSTVGAWRENAIRAFGADSAPVRFFDELLAEQGADEPVLADEGQLLHVLTTLAIAGAAAALLEIGDVVVDDGPPCPMCGRATRIVEESPPILVVGCLNADCEANR